MLDIVFLCINSLCFYFFPAAVLIVPSLEEAILFKRQAHKERQNKDQAGKQHHGNRSLLKEEEPLFLAWIGHADAGLH